MDQQQRIQSGRNPSLVKVIMLFVLLLIAVGLITSQTPCGAFGLKTILGEQSHEAVIVDDNKK